jgi:hypothetical protein
MNFTTAFARYKAKLTNLTWAVSAIAEDGSVVISCWSHYFKPAKNAVLPYVDSLSRWNGSNVPGNNLLRTHLEQAVANNLDVRLVIATTNDEAAVDRGDDASKLSNTFGVREDLVGKVTQFDGDNLVIEFRRDPRHAAARAPAKRGV